MLQLHASFVVELCWTFFILDISSTSSMNNASPVKKPSTYFKEKGTLYKLPSSETTLKKVYQFARQSKLLYCIAAQN